jgi:hypothetical protein
MKTKSKVGLVVSALVVVGLAYWVLKPDRVRAFGPNPDGGPWFASWSQASSPQTYLGHQASVNYHCPAPYYCLATAVGGSVLTDSPRLAYTYTIKAPSEPDQVFPYPAILPNGLSLSTGPTTLNSYNWTNQTQFVIPPNGDLNVTAQGTNSTLLGPGSFAYSGAVNGFQFSSRLALGFRLQF